MWRDHSAAAVDFQSEGDREMLPYVVVAYCFQIANLIIARALLCWRECCVLKIHSNGEVGKPSWVARSVASAA